MSKRLITVSYSDQNGDKELSFNVSQKDVNNYINGDHKNKLQSMYNMLSRVVDDGSRPDFDRLMLDDEGTLNGLAVGNVLGALLEDFGGKVQVEIKKSKATLTA